VSIITARANDGFFVPEEHFHVVLDHMDDYAFFFRGLHCFIYDHYECWAGGSAALPLAVLNIAEEAPAVSLGRAAGVLK